MAAFWMFLVAETGLHTARRLNLLPCGPNLAPCQPSLALREAEIMPGTLILCIRRRLPLFLR